MIVEVLAPSATMVDGEAAMVEVPPEPAPALTVSDATDTCPLTVAVTEWRPETVAEQDALGSMHEPSGAIPKVAVCAPRLWP